MVVKNMKYAPHATWTTVLKSNIRGFALQVLPHGCKSILLLPSVLISWNNIINHVNYTERSWVYFMEYLDSKPKYTTSTEIAVQARTYVPKASQIFFFDHI